MKTRRHHNNKGSRQIKTGRTVEQVRRIAQRLGLPFGTRFVLTEQDYDTFVRRLRNPPEANKTLRGLMRRKPTWAE